MIQHFAVYTLALSDDILKIFAWGLSLAFVSAIVMIIIELCTRRSR